MGGLPSIRRQVSRRLCGFICSSAHRRGAYVSWPWLIMTRRGLRCPGFRSHSVGKEQICISIVQVDVGLHIEPTIIHSDSSLECWWGHRIRKLGDVVLIVSLSSTLVDQHNSAFQLPLECGLLACRAF